MANKNVILKDESGNNLFPKTKIGNILSNDGTTEVNLVTSEDLDELRSADDDLQAQIDGINNSVITKFFDAPRQSGEKYMYLFRATAQNEFTLMNNLPINDIQQIIKLCLTLDVVLMDGISFASQEHEIVVQAAPGFGGFVDIPICWSYNDPCSAIIHLKLSLRFASGSDANHWDLKISLTEANVQTIGSSSAILSEVCIDKFQILYYGQTGN